jgi:hypothetical protein
MPTALGGHGFLDGMATQSRGHGTHQLRLDGLLGIEFARRPQLDGMATQSRGHGTHQLSLDGLLGIKFSRRPRPGGH